MPTPEEQPVPQNIAGAADAAVEAELTRQEENEPVLPAQPEARLPEPRSPLSAEDKQRAESILQKHQQGKELTAEDEQWFDARYRKGPETSDEFAVLERDLRIQKVYDLRAKLREFDGARQEFTRLESQRDDRKATAHEGWAEEYKRAKERYEGKRAEYIGTKVQRFLFEDSRLERSLAQGVDPDLFKRWLTTQPEDSFRTLEVPGEADQRLFNIDDAIAAYQQTKEYQDATGQNKLSSKIMKGYRWLGEQNLEKLIGKVAASNPDNITGSGDQIWTDAYRGAAGAAKELAQGVQRWVEKHPKWGKRIVRSLSLRTAAGAALAGGGFLLAGGTGATIAATMLGKRIVSGTMSGLGAHELMKGLSEHKAKTTGMERQLAPEEMRKLATPELVERLQHFEEAARREHGDVTKDATYRALQREFRQRFTDSRDAGAATKDDIVAVVKDFDSQFQKVHDRAKEKSRNRKLIAAGYGMLVGSGTIGTGLRKASEWIGWSDPAEVPPGSGGGTTPPPEGGNKAPTVEKPAAAPKAPEPITVEIKGKINTITEAVDKAVHQAPEATQDGFIHKVLGAGAEVTDQNRDELLTRAVNKFSVSNLGPEMGQGTDVENLVYEGNVLKLNADGSWDMDQGTSDFGPKAVSEEFLREQAGKLNVNETVAAAEPQGTVEAGTPRVIEIVNEDAVAGSSEALGNVPSELKGFGITEADPELVAKYEAGQAGWHLERGESGVEFVYDRQLSPLTGKPLELVFKSNHLTKDVLEAYLATAAAQVQAEQEMFTRILVEVGKEKTQAIMGWSCDRANDVGLEGFAGSRHGHTVYEYLKRTLGSDYLTDTQHTVGERLAKAVHESAAGSLPTGGESTPLIPEYQSNGATASTEAQVEHIPAPESGKVVEVTLADGSRAQFTVDAQGKARNFEGMAFSLANDKLNSAVLSDGFQEAVKQSQPRDIQFALDKVFNEARSMYLKVMAHESLVQSERFAEASALGDGIERELGTLERTYGKGVFAVERIRQQLASGAALEEAATVRGEQAVSEAEKLLNGSK